MSLTDENYDDDYDGDDDDIAEIDSYGFTAVKNFRGLATQSKLRSYSSSSSSTFSSSESSNSSKSNSYLRKQIKKFKRKEILKKNSTLTFKQEQHKNVPDHLTDYQYFEKDLDDSCLFGIKQEQDSHKKMGNQLQKKSNRIESDDDNEDAEESSCSSLSLNKFDSSSSSEDDESDTGNDDTDDTDKSSESNTSDSSKSNASSNSSSDNSSRVLHKPIPAPIFIRQENTSTSLSRAYFSNLTNKYSRLREVGGAASMLKSNPKMNNNENLKDALAQDLSFLDKVVNNKTVDDCIQIEKHVNEDPAQDCSNPEDDDDYMNEKYFDNFYSVNTDNLDYETHQHDANYEVKLFL